MYGDAGLKSDFGGHNNYHTSNIYAYVGSRFGRGNNLSFVNNSCVLRTDRGYGSDCGLPSGMAVSGNAVYSPSGNITACGMSLAQWLAEGHDIGTTIRILPNDKTLVAMGRTLLGLK